MKGDGLQRTVRATTLALCLGSGGLPGAGAIPPPPDRFMADCQTPTYASDVVVCDDEELLSRDREVTRLYDLLRDALEPDGSDGLLDSPALFESQHVWFRRRGLCAFSSRQADCLRAAYDERLRVLGALRLQREQASAEVAFAVCRNAPWGLGPTGISATQVGEIVLSAPSGRVRAVATGGLPRDDWTPYLHHEAEGGQLRLFPLEGPVMTCELREPD